MDLKDTIQQDPIKGFIELEKLIVSGKLSHIGKAFEIKTGSRLEVRVYSREQRKIPILVCLTPSEIETGLKKFPFSGTTDAKNEFVWEYRIFNGSKESKAVNINCALTHRSGFIIE